MFFMKINHIPPQESDFTEVLNTIALKPKMLYFYGEMPKNVSFSQKIAIVGSRKPTEYGRKIAYELAYELAQAGAVVVSGLALGIDTVAHRGALDAGGRTVAVLGTPINQIYPRTHKAIAEEIVKKNGAIISEYGPEMKIGVDVFMKTSFLARNRLISGLAKQIVIVEAAKRSGSLNTAMHALEQGRNLWVVPGEIGKINSEGCNRLISQGAEPIVSVKEFVEEIFPERRKRRKRKAVKLENALERKIVECLGRGENDGEEILRVLGIEAVEFNMVMTLMEIRGVVKSLGGNKWMLV